MPFLNGIDLYLIQVDRLNWVFGLIFSMMAAIGGIYSMHNKSWMEALASMCYAGGALGVTLCGDLDDTDFLLGTDGCVLSVPDLVQ